MRCIVCGGHATWERTVFKGTEPTRVRLCDACQAKVQADTRIARIKDAIEAHFRTVPYLELEGAAGTERLRADLNLILNNALKPVTVRGVLIFNMQLRRK